jgi:spermidine synthase
MSKSVLLPDADRPRVASEIRAVLLPRSAHSVVAALFVVSGASGLILEIVWSRMLGWLLGATTWSVMTVLVAFMGGLGAGGIIWGRLVVRWSRPLRLFGWLEIAIGLYTLAVPVLFEWLGFASAALTRIVGESLAGDLAVRVVTAVLALAPPTFLMGGTLPILTRFAASGEDEPGTTAGWLYAANTVGAVAGCFLAGCFGIFLLGVRETNTAAAFLDLGVGALALTWDRRHVESFAPGVVLEERRRVPDHLRVALWIAMVSGFCGLAYEVLWTRGLLAAITDDTTYAFTLMLTAFLAGHAAGAAAASRTSGIVRPDRSWRQLGTAQILAALAALLSLPFLVIIRDPINRATFIEGMSFWGGRIPLHLAISVVVFAPSAFFLGMSFALASRLYVGHGRPIAASTGKLYGLNTLAAILGAIVTTAWLIPALGVQRSLMVLAGLQTVVGAWAILRHGGATGDWPRRLWADLAWIIVMVLACGINVLLPLSSIYARQEPYPSRLLALVEGSGAAVTVHQRTPTDRVISINGVNVAGTNPVLRATQKLQAHLPVCLHRHPRAVLQIGFGSGGTCYSVSLHRGIESIEVVELNPDVIDVASTWFGDINHGVLNDSRVRVRICDAKSYVATAERSYDLILSDSTHPRFRGNAALYARDYFAHCARRLRPGGMVSTWLPLYGLSVADIRGILKSLQAVFPHVQVWYANSEPHENTIVIASREPIVIDPVSLSRRLSDPPVAADLAEVGISSTIQLLDFFMLGDRAVADFSRTGKLNTDDHPRLEFTAPKTGKRRQSFVDNFAAIRLAREPIAPYLSGADPVWRERLKRWYDGTTFKLAGQSLELEGRGPEAIDAYAEGVLLNREDVLARIRLRLLRRALAMPASTGSTAPLAR